MLTNCNHITGGYPAFHSTLDHPEQGKYTPQTCPFLHVLYIHSCIFLLTRYITRLSCIMFLEFTCVCEGKYYRCLIKPELLFM
ncbi:hypothetical protein M6B38_196800 [Iris pallida]|uniref:Uncharacterized protein n=1 Tax=Iris pallida TaxID=29817 RepID=A0AAX6EBW0_IRIPA|nr:hypothetical protein M6B38_196800 [Iris pallida]